MTNTKQETKPILLGHVSVPSGTMLVLDPGLARFWRHDGDPKSPRKSDTAEYDLQITGPDALECGKLYDRQFDPRYIFDSEDPAGAKKHFSEFAATKKLNAQLQLLEKRIPHLERARLAAEIGGGAGVVHYNKLWGVAISGIPRDRSFPIHATAMPEGEFNGRWRSIDIIIDENATVARSEETVGVMVEHGQLICSDLEAFGQFRMWESVDGLADFVFWGRDAAEVAKKFKAQKLNEREFGWVNLPEKEIDKHAEKVQDYIDSKELKVGVDYRPHCNLEKLNVQIRETDNAAGQLTLNNAALCGFENRWGDGIFEIIRDFDAAGSLVRIRIDLGNEKRLTLMRRIWMRSLGALVTKKILEHGEPIRFAERTDPNNPRDSGWLFTSGTEDDEYMDDADNIAVVPIGWILQKKDPTLEEILNEPVYSVFRREANGWILEQD